MIERILKGVENFSILTWQSLFKFFQRPYYARELIHQIDRIGIGSIFIVSLTGFFTGMVLALQAAVQLERFGATFYVGQLVSASSIRELGPVLTALMVTGRVGSAYTAEIGAMVVGEQVDAMRMEGVDIIRKLVVARLQACLISLPLLTVVADLFAILGGYIICYYQLRISGDLYWRTVTEVLFMSDVIFGLIKPFFFAFLISMISCYKGLFTRGDTVGIGLSTQSSVVTTSILILMTDFFITKIHILMLP